MLATAVSARNQLQGIVQSIEQGLIMSKVVLDVDGLSLTSIITKDSIEELSLQKGDSLSVLIKATSVMILKDEKAKVSGRNKIPATIQNIQRGQIVSKITLEYKGNLLIAIIDNDSVEDLALQTGDQVVALIKATNVLVMK